MILFNLREILSTSPARRNKLIMSCFFITLGLDILLWIVLLWKFVNYPEYIILRYNIYFGISDLGPWFWILLMPLFGLLVLLANFVLALWLYLKNSLISYFLIWTALFFNAALFVAGALLIYSNL